VNLSWLDDDRVQHNIIGRLVARTPERIRVLVASRIEPPLTMRFWMSHGASKGKAKLVGTVGKAGGFVAELVLLPDE
jgi:hypothetical protein